MRLYKALPSKSLCQTIRSSFLDCAFHMLQRDTKHSCFFRAHQQNSVHLTGVHLSGTPYFSVILNYLCLLAAKSQTVYPQINILDLSRQNTKRDSLKFNLHLLTSKYVNYCTISDALLNSISMCILWLLFSR